MALTRCHDARLHDGNKTRARDYYRPQLLHIKSHIKSILRTTFTLELYEYTRTS